MMEGWDIHTNLNVKGQIKSRWQEKEIRNSPTPLPESSGPGCPTLEQGFWVRDRDKKGDKNMSNSINQVSADLQANIAPVYTL